MSCERTIVQDFNGFVSCFCLIMSNLVSAGGKRSQQAEHRGENLNITNKPNVCMCSRFFSFAGFGFLGII